MKKLLTFPILLRWFAAIFLFSFGVFKAEAQGAWAASGCSASDPKILKVFVNACYNPEGYNEFVYMQTVATPWNWANFNVVGSNGNYTAGTNSGSPNFSPVANSFATNISIVNQLNSAVGSCSNPVFYAAPNPIPANSIVMVTMSNVGIAGLSTGAIAALCGQGPIFVISGNFTSTVPSTPGSGNFGFFKNAGCLGLPIGCTPSAIFNFGNGCTKTLTYNLANMADQDGEYFLEDGTQGISGCFDLPTITIPCTPPAAPQISNPTITTCENTTIPSSNVFTCTNCPSSYNVFTASTGGTAIYTGNNFPSGTFSNPSASTTYYIEQTVGTCTSATRTPVNIQVNPLPQAAPTVNNITCSNPTVTVNAGTTSQGANFSYVWIGPNGFSSNILTPTLSSAGTYSLTVTNTTSGCTKTASVTVANAATGFTATATPTSTNCGQNNGSISVTPNGSGYTYTWSGGLSGSNPTNIAAGSYTVTVTQTATGCTSTVSATVNSSTGFTATATATPTTCGQNNGSISVTPNGSGYTYAWTSGLPSGANLTNLQSGTYTVIVTETATGCTSSASATVNGSIGINATATVTPTSCGLNNGAISVAPNGSGYTYVWLGGVSGSNPTGLASSSYSVTVTQTSTGCTSTATPIVANSIGFTAVATSTAASCGLNNGSISVTPNGSGYSYAWSNSSLAGANPTGVASGSYTVTVTQISGGCTSTANATVNTTGGTINAVIATPQVLTCNNNATTTLNTSGTSTGANITYAWSGPNNFSSNVLSPPVTNAGTYTLSVTNTTNGCTKTASVIVLKDVTTPTLAPFSQQVLTCYNNGQVSVGGIATNGTNFTYTWNTGSTTPIQTVTSPNVYCVTVTNANNGCKTTQCVTITEDKMIPNISIAAAPMLTCVSPTVKLSASGSTGANFVYNWSGGNIVSGANTLTPTVNQAAVYTITVTNNSNGCTKTAATDVIQNTVIPSAVIAPPQILNCSNPSIVLNPTGTSTGVGIIYAWSGPNAFSSYVLIPPNITVEGTYSLTVTNSTNGCTKTTTTDIIKDFSLPNAVVAPSGQLSCASPSVVLNTTGTSTGANFTYNWSSSNGFISTLLSPTVTIEGTYILTVTNTTNGCTKTAQALVTKSVDFPTANAGLDKVLGCKITIIQLGGGSSTGANFTYAWSGVGIVAGASTQTPTVNQAGTYILTVTNTSTGCTQSDEVVVTLNTTPPSLSITPSNLTVNCGNPSATLTANGAGTFLWSTGENTAVISVSPSFLTTYSVTLTGNNDCVNSKDITIAVDNSVKGLAASIGTPLCVGQSIMLNASGGVKYLWSGVNQYSSTLANNVIPNVTAKDAGTYSVSVTGANGCSIVVLADVIIKDCVATNDISQEKSIVIFPNPVENQLRISALENITNVILTNSIGQDIFTKKENNKEITIEMSHFASGTYTLTVQTAFAKKIFKVVKI